MAKILVVEAFEGVAVGIRRMGHEVLTAENPEAGRLLALRSMPDLIVVDDFPGMMNGPKFCDMLENDLATRNIPLILHIIMSEMVKTGSMRAQLMPTFRYVLKDHVLLYSLAPLLEKIAGVLE